MSVIQLRFKKKDADLKAWFFEWKEKYYDGNSTKALRELLKKVKGLDE